VTILAVRDLVAGYEPGVPIVRGASLEVAAGEILALLGPNGAGKSTLVRAITGLVRVESGRVLLDGADVTGRPAHRLVRDGVGYVPQTDNVFTRMTVDEHLDLAGAALDRTGRRVRRAAMFDLFPDLGTRRRLPAGRLSGGQRQMLAMARALLPGPRLLLLDEPSAGLAPLLVGAVLARLRDARALGVAIVLVEQNTRAALAVADRGCIMVEGRPRLTAPAADLSANPAVAQLYLGSRPPGPEITPPGAPGPLGSRPPGPAGA
jgi:branched-chain amino acid transport system ATP-binding protein